jgi:F-type H+-transporting ATPase subunit delta
MPPRETIATDERSYHETDMGLARGTARRYAEAAFEIAERDDSIEAWLAALEIAEERLSVHEVMRFLSNPSLAAASRIEVLGRIVGDDVGAPQRNLLALMVRRGRFEQLPAIIREFRRLYRLREGIVEATVTSAVDLDVAEVEALRSRLEAMTDKHIELSQAVDPELLGGLQVRVGDELIDGSVRGRLERLRSDFMNIAI